MFLEISLLFSRKIWSSFRIIVSLTLSYVSYTPSYNSYYSDVLFDFISLLVYSCYIFSMRFNSIDILRGIAILGMIAFHANYMLEHVFYISDFHFSDTFWYFLWRIVAILFITLSWAAFFFSSYRKNRTHILRRSWHRCIMLSSIALSITIITHVFFFEQRIYFGIIHFFALASLLMPFLIRFSFRVHIILIIVSFLFPYFPIPSNISLLTLPLWFPPWDFYSADYYPLFPWIGYMIIGYLMTAFLFHHGWERYFIFPRMWTEWLAWTWKHSLILYVVHVPILYGVFYLLSS